MDTTVIDADDVLATVRNINLSIFWQVHKKDCFDKINNVLVDLEGESFVYLHFCKISKIWRWMEVLYMLCVETQIKHKKKKIKPKQIQKIQNIYKKAADDCKHSFH